MWDEDKSFKLLFNIKRRVFDCAFQYFSLTHRLVGLVTVIKILIKIFLSVQLLTGIYPPFWVMFISLCKLSFHDFTSHTFTIVFPFLPSTTSANFIIFKSFMDICATSSRIGTIFTNGRHGTILENFAPV